MRSIVRRMGDFYGVVIPQPLLAVLGVKLGDDVEITADNGKIVIAPIGTHPRSGWAKDAQAIAAAGDDCIVWPDFANSFDETWTW